MAKDPAFLFYPNDYIGGTMGMTFEEKGAYIELLMLQFNRGHMTSHMIGQMVGQIWDKIKDKFIQDNQGLWFNERLESEISKRKNFTESRRNNMSGKNQYSKNNKGNDTISESHTSGHMTSHTIGHMENENGNINIDNNNNLIKETKEKNILINYSEFVKLKVDEYEKLKIEYGEDAANEFIEILNNYKGSTGKKYKSDYLAIKNWVIEKYNDRHRKIQGSSPTRERDYESTI